MDFSSLPLQKWISCLAALGCQRSTNIAAWVCVGVCDDWPRVRGNWPNLRLNVNNLQRVSSIKHLGVKVEGKIDGCQEDTMISRSRLIKNMELLQEFVFAPPRPTVRPSYSTSPTSMGWWSGTWQGGPSRCWRPPSTGGPHRKGVLKEGFQPDRGWHQDHDWQEHQEDQGRGDGSPWGSKQWFWGGCRWQRSHDRGARRVGQPTPNPYCNHWTVSEIHGKLYKKKHEQISVQTIAFSQRSKDCVQRLSLGLKTVFDPVKNNVLRISQRKRRKLPICWPRLIVYVRCGSIQKIICTWIHFYFIHNPLIAVPTGWS